MNTKNIKAVIFDMDGTLINTEKYYRMFWPKALAHFGYEMTDEQALTMRSLGQPYAPQHLKEMFVIRIWIIRRYEIIASRSWESV